MSKLFVYSKNIPRRSLEPYYPANVHLIDEKSINIDVYDDSRAQVTISATGILHDNCQIIPTLAIASETGYGYKCFLLIGNPVKEFALTGVGIYGNRGKSGNQPSCEVIADIDSFGINKLPKHADIVFKLISSDITTLLKQPLLISLSVTPVPEMYHDLQINIDSRHEISVPEKSQTEYDQSIQHRICSPTCLAMVLDYYGKDAEVPKLAELAYNQEHDLFGVWPSNIWAATQFACLGYIHRFSDFKEAKTLLDKNTPLITSIRYKEGELANSAIKKTPGHLVVLRGYHKDCVIVNDPAADPGAVKRNYALDEFLRVWISGKGVAYVLVPVPE